MAEARVAVEANQQPVPVEDFKSVDKWGVTHPVFDLVSFRWTVRNFLQKSFNGTSTMYSPVYLDKKHKNCISGGRQWQLRLVPHVHEETGRSYMSCHLYLLSMLLSPVFNRLLQAGQEQEGKVRANYRISIVDKDGNVLKEAGGPNTPTCTFKEMAGWGYNYMFSIDSVTSEDQNLLLNGDMIIKCEIWIRDKRPSYDRHGQGGSDWKGISAEKKLANQNKLADDFGQLFENGFLADVTVQAGSSKEVFSAHKLALAAASPVFAAMLSLPTQERQENIVKIPDFEPPVVRAMLEYMYSSKLDPGFLQENCMDLFQIADKYGLEELMGICQEAIAENLTTDNCMTILALADVHNSEWLMERCIGYFGRHEKAIKRSSAFWNVQKQRPDLVLELYSF